MYAVMSQYKNKVLMLQYRDTVLKYMNNVHSDVIFSGIVFTVMSQYRVNALSSLKILI